MKKPFFKIGDVVSMDSNSKTVTDYGEWNMFHQCWEVIVVENPGEVSEDYAENQFDEFESSKEDFPDTWFCRRDPEVLALLMRYFKGTCYEDQIMLEWNNLHETVSYEFMGFYNDVGSLSFELHTQTHFLDSGCHVLTRMEIIGKLQEALQRNSSSSVESSPKPSKSPKSTSINLQGFADLSVKKSITKFF